MGKTSEIEWTDATWNPWYGCRKVSSGCKLCYAERDMTRYGRDFSKVTRAAPATFNAPLKWKEGRRIFTCSWSDFFIEQADPWRAEAWDIIRATPYHNYMILTKRVELIIPDKSAWAQIYSRLPWALSERPWPHVMIGTSVEDQKTTARIWQLLMIPAAFHFLSYEPGLGPLDWDDALCSVGGMLAGKLPEKSGPSYSAKLDLIIVGGESARPRSKARPFHLEWAFGALAQCRAAGVACFVKQLGSNPYYHGQPLRLRDWKGGDMSEWPEQLRVRELPNAQR